MKIYRDISQVQNLTEPVVTTGTFDGVHLGHQKILQHLTQSAKKIGGESVVLTFWPHPRMVVFPNDHGLQLLNTLEEKAELLEKHGVDHFIIYPFSQKFSRISAESYVKEILVDGIGVRKMAVGYDHRFGKNREGDFEQLQTLSQQYNFEVEEISAEDVDNINVSSTKVRNALESGNLEIAQEYLSYAYFFSATVVKGEGVGRTLGFPTANLLPEDPLKLIPKNGVYVVWVVLDGNPYRGMMNIGVRPTITNENRKSIEVHLFDFDEDLYGKNVRISFVKRLRDEKKFEDITALKKQLHEDKNECLLAFAAM